MDILPCAALSGKEHGRTSWSNCNTADTHHNEEIPRKGCLDRYPLLLKLEKNQSMSNTCAYHGRSDNYNIQSIE